MDFPCIYASTNLLTFACSLSRSNNTRLLCPSLPLFNVSDPFSIPHPELNPENTLKFLTLVSFLLFAGSLPRDALVISPGPVDIQELRGLLSRASIDTPLFIYVPYHELPSIVPARHFFQIFPPSSTSLEETVRNKTYTRNPLLHVVDTLHIYFISVKIQSGSRPHSPIITSIDDLRILVIHPRTPTYTLTQSHRFNSV